MSYLVSEFFINPVLRQARRFSSGFATTPEPDDEIAASCQAPLPPSQWNAIEEDDLLGTTTDEISLAVSHDMAAVEQLPLPQLESADTADLSSSHLDLTAQQQPPQRPQDATTITTPQRHPEASASTPSTGDSHSLPEDDGMGALRRRIIEIQARDLPQEEKAVLMHELLMEGYNRRQVQVAVKGVESRLRPESKYMWEQALSTGPLESYKFWNHLGDGVGGLSLKVNLSEDDLRPTYVPLKEDEDVTEEERAVRPLGCEHYRRNVKMQCATCERWYTCRLCHDAVEDHQLPRRQTAHMLCMFCGTAQKVGDTCIKCQRTAARYYCGVCKLWNDDPDKSIYHCNDCGICRVGQGLGKDFFHCNKCMACIAVSISQKHKCIERSTDRDCPICGDNMFDSVKRVIFMSCGHTIHDSCFKELLKTSYRCPLCSKSVVNMEIQFRNYDAAIQHQPMPDEYRDTRAIVSCNDCSAKSQTAYHWLGLRCSICQSYNTVPLQVLNLPSNAVPLPSGSEVAALAVGAGAGAVSATQGLDALPSPPLAPVAPPTMTAGPSRQGSRQNSMPPAPWAPRQPSLPQETSESSVESVATSTGPAYSDRMENSPPPLPVPALAAPPPVGLDDNDADNNPSWDGDLMGHILSSPGESDNDAAAVRGSGVSELGDSDDGEEEEEEEDDDDDRDDPFTLPGHR